MLLKHVFKYLCSYPMDKKVKKYCLFFVQQRELGCKVQKQGLAHYLQEVKT